ncbi:hypothetical protein PI125_g9914 [Phytophthora idaei]|nr:hypothetical protein PI125_g9914 [Phytophthora idaei]KAG3157711.1 hypothetical protein PI126_g8155 [Phytophthora idaei]
MDGRFWVLCRNRGSAKAKAYAWARKDIPRYERNESDEKFFRSRAGKDMGARFWLVDRTGSLLNGEDEEDPRDEVELLESCLRLTELEICGAPDCKLLKRLHIQYVDRLRIARLSTQPYANVEQATEAGRVPHLRST